MPNSSNCQRCRQRFEPRSGEDALCPSCDSVARPGMELRLRSDLVIEPVESQDSQGLHYVIHDPGANRYYRIKPLEHFLVTQFDGTTSFAEIRRRASEERRVLVSEEVLAAFAEKFRSLGLLFDTHAGMSREALEAGNGRLQRPLTLKQPLANPEKLLEWLYPWTSWCFSKSFVLMVSATLIAALAVALVNREQLVFGLGEIFNIEGLIFVLLTVLGVTLVHEIAHGLTCRHFGGRVTDMGFLLLYGLPCFYCNVSDTYFFREKRQRLWVFFAGGFVEIFIWALSVLAWRVVAPETWVARVLFVVIAVCGVRSLFNFNPLIKLDGYYLLSDYLGIANLRAESLAGLGRVARRLLGLEVKPPPEAIRNRRILAMPGHAFLTLFGLAAVMYTAGLIGYLAFESGDWVFRHFGSDGLGVFSILLVGLLHKPAVTAASAAKGATKEKWRQLGERKRRPRFVLIWTAVLLVVALFPWQLRIPTELSILPLDRATVRAPTEGRIARIHFAEGQRVRAGDLLLEFDSKELELQHQTKQAELTHAQEELRLLSKKNPNTREEIRVQQRALETARAQEAAAHQSFERAQQLWTLGLFPKNDFDDAKNALDEAEAHRREVEAQLNLVLKSSPASRNEQMEVLHLRDAGAQEAIIQQLEAELAQLEDQLSRTKIYASISGILTTYRFEEKMGEYLEEGAEVCEIANDDEVVVEMPVSEKDIDTIQLGQAVKFKVRGYPSKSFNARVDEIAPVATPSKQEHNATIMIRSFIDNEEELLKPGMTGVAKIYGGTTFLANIFTRDLVRFIRTEFWL